VLGFKQGALWPNFTLCKQHLAGPRLAGHTSKTLLPSCGRL
jgi:hypothetical protein